MLDPKFVRDHPDAIKLASTQKRVGSPALVDQWLAADAERRAAQTAADGFRAQQGNLGKFVGRLKNPKTADSVVKELAINFPDAPSDTAAATEFVLAKSTALKQQYEAEQAKQADAETRSAELMLQLPAIPDAAWPIGRDAEENVVVRTWHAPGREPRELASNELDHIALGQKLGILDFDRGVKVAGSRSYILRGGGAMLYQAVLRFAMDVLTQRGFEPFIVPVLVTEACMTGTGYFPAGRDQAYVTQDSTVLVGTSEVPLASFHGDEILDESKLPLKFAATSTCFRREAGAAGRDTAGLYRVHQFDKVEQVVIHRADQSEHIQLHEEIIANSEFILQQLGLAYRVVQNCTGDMGQGKWRMYDIETWMPSRKAYGETHSGSALRDFQSRRLNLRYRAAGEKTPLFAYTLNNTAIACPRVLIALLETWQNADGTLAIPEALQPYMSGTAVIPHPQH